MGGRQTTGLAVHGVLGRLECSEINGVLEDVYDGFADALGRFQVTALLDAMRAAHELSRQDGAHRAAADPREDMKLQVPNHLRRVPGRPLMILLSLCVPRAGHQFEGVQSRDALAFLIDTSGKIGRAHV